MRFSFTGTLGYSTSEKRPLVREGVTAREARYKSLSLSIANGRNNRGFVELLGVENTGDKIRIRNTSGENEQIDWDDRNDPDVMNRASSLSKYTIDTGTERKEFLAPWDLISYVQKHIEEMNGKKYTITGRVRRDIYKGAVTNRFELQGIYAAAEDAKEQLRVTGEVFFTADDIDLSDWKKEKKITISGYTREYISKDEGNKYLQQTLTYDCSKVDPANKQMLERVQFVTESFGVEVNDEMEAKLALKKKKVYRNNFICAYVNGSETFEFDESMLTPYQKRGIATGALTLDDCRPSGQIYGDRVVMIKVVKPIVKDEYKNGIVTDEMTIGEFGSDVYQPELPSETAEEALEKGMNPPEEPKAKTETGLSEDELDDIFA